MPLTVYRAGQLRYLPGGRKIIDIRGDIRDVEALSGVFTAYSPEFVFHLAAQALVRRAYESPKETYDVNVGGTVNLFECCRMGPSARVIVNVTSDKCYENREWLWVQGKRPHGGYDPYSSSKGCSELVTAAYRNSFFNPSRHREHGKALSSVRAGNVIGGGTGPKTHHPRLCPGPGGGLSHTRPEPAGGAPLAIRAGAARRVSPAGARMAVNPAEYAGPWNFGPESRSVLTVRDIVELVIRAWGSGDWKDGSVPNQPHEASLLALDVSKARYRLGWTPTLAAEQAVMETLAWYRQYTSSSDMQAFCLAQIDRYMEQMQIHDPGRKQIREEILELVRGCTL